MLVAGAGGFAKEIAAVICQNNADEAMVFYDDINHNAPEYLFNNYPVLRTSEDARNYFIKKDIRFVLGLGNPVFRCKMAEKFKNLGGKLSTVFSSTARVGRFGNVIGEGVSIMNNVVIEADNIIGTGCLIHNAAFISHDVRIGSFCEISPCVNLLGNAETGNFCSIGTGATILPKIKIGNNVVIGAGAVVTKDIPDNSLAFGMPATIIKSLDPLTFE